MDRPRRRSARIALVTATAAAVLLAGTTAATAAKPANGAGSNAALSSPDCDRDRGTVKLPYAAAPPCVKPFAQGDDNGGATSQGVTADSIKVIVRRPSDEDIASSTSPPRDRSTGQTAPIERAYADAAAIFERTNEQWGRTVEFEYFLATGTDEAAQRADAVEVLAEKPFAVIDIAGGDVFETLVAQDEVLSISPTTGTNRQSIAQSPYRWTATTDYTATALIGAEFVGKQLLGGKAEYAGDEALQSKPRVFGVVRSTAPNAPETKFVDAELQRYKVKPVVDLEYEPSTDSTTARQVAEQNAGPMVSRLKDAGVTSVILLAADYPTIGALTRAMKTQEYSPEIVTMGVGLIDIGLLARGTPPGEFDQDVWSHAFGVLTLYPPVVGVTAGPSDLTFRWFWGDNQGVYSQTAFSTVEILFSGIHMAGPKLTPKAFKDGMFARPAVGGIAEGMRTNTVRAYGKKAGLPYDEYMVGGDATLAWWDPDKVGPSVSVAVADAKGNWMFLDDAKRYGRGDIPTKKQQELEFFDPSGAMNAFTTVPETDVMPAYPCDDCPVNGGAAT
jgi:hypothetical protein